MNSYTFLIDSESIHNENLLEQVRSSLDDLLMTGGGIKAEVIIRGKVKHTIRKNKYLKVVHSTDGAVTDFQKAIVNSSGEWIIITSASTFVDSCRPILQEVIKVNNHRCVLPVSMAHHEKVLGIRRLNSVPYFAIKKSYAINFINHSRNLQGLLRSVDKDLELFFYPDTQIESKRSIIHNAVLIRPYATIFTRKVKYLNNRVAEYYRKKRAERLSRNVLRVKYSEDIPVFIICRDRVSPLKKLVKWLEDEGLKNIYFIDNASTYKPLLDYLENTPYSVLTLNVNAGHTAPWSEGMVQLYAANRPFIVTDPDVIPTQESHGAVKLFARLLNDHLERTKVGFGLRIDNLPDHYDLKQHVISWEKQFWVSKVEDDVYDAEIDTTFALYRPNTPYVLGPGLRTGGRFVAEHEPWYIDSNDIPDELVYYRDHADKVIGSWGVVAKDVTDTYANYHLSNNK